MKKRTRKNPVDIDYEFIIFLTTGPNQNFLDVPEENRLRITYPDFIELLESNNVIPDVIGMDIIPGNSRQTPKEFVILGVLEGKDFKIFLMDDTLTITPQLRSVFTNIAIKYNL